MPPLTKTSLVDEVVVALRERLANGELRPGETVHIEALTREFEISRTPVREAFSRLEAEGLLVRRTGHAATVFAPVRREVLEYYEMRLVLEPLAARLALPNVTPEIERELVALVGEMDDFTAHNWYGINRAFHQALYEPSGRDFLVTTIDNLIQRSDPYIHMYFATHDLAETQSGHRQILTAVTEGDEAGLVAAVTEHLGHALNEIVAVIPTEDER